MFGGYPYNPLTMTRVLGARMPGASPEMIDKAFFDERDEVPPYEHQPWHDSPEHEAKLGESMAWAMSTDSLPNLDADKELARSLREQRPDLTVLTDVGTARSGAIDGAVHPADVRERDDRVVAVGARHRERSARSARASATRRW